MSRLTPEREKSGPSYNEWRDEALALRAELAGSRARALRAGERAAEREDRVEELETQLVEAKEQAKRFALALYEFECVRLGHIPNVSASTSTVAAEADAAVCVAIEGGTIDEGLEGDRRAYAAKESR